MDDSSFFSMDRLVEFGMGITVAQQMVRAMNESMTSMNIPGAMNQMQKPKEIFFYAMIEGFQAGPFSEHELARLIAEKKVSKETYVWMPPMSNWEMAEQIPEVLKLVALTPPPFQQNK
ncbi:DUF4339 domain-containing protein [Nonlabens sp.]|uniref:DUF4339 domain-containing protein n=1 Tax=Nonlabens sp. TaxID=1888209 RepID=UPI001BCC0FB1|nr:DUF4339 domain-containing protein [Nonlabens sp.]